ncbi:MAG: hypothetical protein WCL51_10755 [Bacteroidota bacterium]
MKRINKLYFLLLALLIITSCGQVAKEVAKDTLSGTYVGKVKYIYQYSLLNIGINDVEKTEKCNVTIYKLKKTTTINTPDGLIEINGIRLLINGASFNIPEQEITSSSNNTLDIIGLSINEDTEGNKMDGAIDEKDNLSFAFSSKISVNESGVKYELPIETVYTLKKINKTK